MIYNKLDRKMKEEYFSALKRTGVGGIIMPYDKIFSDNLIYAKNNDFSVWITLDTVVKENVSSISCDSSEITLKKEEAVVTSLSLFRESIKAIPKSDLALIDGVIINYPKFPQLMFDDSFKADFYKDFQNYIDDFLYLLIEPAEKQSPFRTWYYEKCENYIYKNYIRPLTSWAKTKGLKLCFDIGNEASEYIYRENHIDIITLLENDVSLLVNHDTRGITEVCVLLSKYNKDSFVVSDEHDYRLANLDINIIGQHEESHIARNKPTKNILLIRSSRGVSERIVMLDNASSKTTENDAITASFESTYYTDMLYEKGFDFEVASEKLFEKNAVFKNDVFTYKGKRINEILLCNSCIFSKKGINLLNKIADSGICINNKNLINILASDLL